jgi:hypothetical protein
MQCNVCERVFDSTTQGIVVEPDTPQETGYCPDHADDGLVHIFQALGFEAGRVDEG